MLSQPPIPIALASSPGPHPQQDTVMEFAASTTRTEADSPSKTTTIIVISSVTVVTMTGSVIAGLVTVAIPVIAQDIGLQQNLLLWPGSVFSLTRGCTLLLSGALADLFGFRTQLITFLAFAGITQAMCLPSAVGLITHAFVPGKRQNLAFASMGSGQPLGFTIGLVFGGVLVTQSAGDGGSLSLLLFIRSPSS
ncbi:hypothetical protein FOYG_03936 [Fusarium oxysporum NRRL 32931]|uniref:Major facilitator superfamily (MFS) profile domain-containing protein n=1 Tax=Fusarium oxysporum NRRL 32931 TaxID=660029 RepID=W9IYH8_FUSOX|nr:hypothetical protein FOYG_03936 [Fusarium oxysporum NRRL 32931]